MRQHRRLVHLAVVVFVWCAWPLPLTAQEPDTALARQLAEQQLSQGVTTAQLLQQLEQSGITREEARTRLTQAGQDPAIADRYFDMLERGELPDDPVPDDILQVLRNIGLSIRQQEEEVAAAPQPDTGALSAGLVDSGLTPDPAAAGPQIFGRSLFEQLTSQFDPVLSGPVDPDYRLGPTDELALVLFGDVELAHPLEVTREGYIIIPNVGRIWVAGLTLAELEDQLYDRLGERFSGIKRGPEATTHFQVSIGRLRAIQVSVLGEVERPSAYELSAVSNVLEALYRAGGPEENGSFRRVDVIRDGERITTIDLYDYILRGDSRDDVRLEHQDIVFVPTAGPHVTIEGAVGRPAIYEVGPEEGLREVIANAGGLEPQAVLRRVQIDRIVAPERRRPGVDRILVDVDVDNLLRSDGELEPVQAGDLVRIFAVSEERRHRIVVEGEVRRPGVHQWTEGMTLWDLIDRAEGLQERAYTPRAHIYRLVEADESRRMIATELLADSTGTPLQDVELADRDSVVIYSQATLTNPEFVGIHGFVKDPGTYALADGMSVEDLILAAGGFVHGALSVEAEVVRFPNGLQRTESTAEIYHVSLRPSTEPSERVRPSGNGTDNGRLRFAEGVSEDYRPGQIPAWIPGPDEFELQHSDQVFIRRAPGFEEPREVFVTGEVLLPGTHMLRQREERISDVIRRAGGTTEEAHGEGLQLIREGLLVPTDLDRALSEPGGAQDLVLEPGDSVHVPRYDPTVLVTGAVAFESRIPYVPGQGFGYYVNRAGGFADNAVKKRASIVYQNGARATVSSFLFFRSMPTPRPGSTIVVPVRPESERTGINWTAVLSGTLSAVTTAALLIRALD